MSAQSDFETAMTAYDAALIARDFPAAWIALARAEGTLGRMAIEMQHDTEVIKYRENLQGAQNALKQAQAAASASGGRGSRMIRTGMRF